MNFIYKYLLFIYHIVTTISNFSFFALIDYLFAELFVIKYFCFNTNTHNFSLHGYFNFLNSQISKNILSSFFERSHRKIEWLLYYLPF